MMQKNKENIAIHLWKQDCKCHMKTFKPIYYFLNCVNLNIVLVLLMVNKHN